MYIFNSFKGFLCERKGITIIFFFIYFEKKLQWISSKKKTGYLPQLHANCRIQLVQASIKVHAQTVCIVEGNSILLRMNFLYYLLQVISELKK